MTLVLEQSQDTLAGWKAGPKPAALAGLLGEVPLSTRLDRVHFPGKKLVQLVYTATMRSGLTLPVLAEHCPDGAADHAAQVTQSLRKSRNGQRQALIRSPIVTDPVSGLVLRRPGLDERLSGLRILHDLCFARESVAQLTGDDPGAVRTRLLAHRLGKRAVIRIDCRTGSYFARIRAVKSNEGEIRLARHKSIWQALGPAAPFAIPEPLGSNPDLGLALFRELPGSPPDFSRDHHSVARSIEALQSLEVKELPRHTGRDEARILQDWLARCQIYKPGLANAIEPLITRTCEDLAATCGRMLPCHRDLHEKQILVQKGRAGFLDFDTLSLAEPALDPGNLLAHLFFAGQDERSFATEIDLPGVGLWRRAALLRVAMIYAFTSTPDTEISRLVSEARR